MSISIEQLWVVPDVAGKKMDFLMDTGATYPVLNSSLWAPFLQKLHRDSCRWKASHLSLHWPLPGQPQQCLISRALLVVPKCLNPLLGRDLLGSLGTIKQLGQPEQPHILTLTIGDQPESKVLFPAIFYRE